MKGFNEKFVDFPDYIISITHEIWEGRNLASLHDYYGEDIVVRSPAGLTIGNKDVIAQTAGTLNEFPDRTLYGEDVIWSGTPEDGMLSSHRILSEATHMGDGQFGAATGKKLRYRIIADCHAINNQINDEWLIRDLGAIVRQLGHDPKAFAIQQIADQGGHEHCARPFTPAMDKQGPYLGKGNDNEWGQRYAEVLTRMMNAEFSCIPDDYDRACQAEYPGGLTVNSWGAIDQFWIGLRASFPNATFKIEHQIGRDDPMMPPRAAIRFSLHGKHEGWGHFGQPSGADVYLMAAAHVEFGPYGIRREFVLFDETAIWKQIALHTG
ncbi:nuclear transport factor 2 family protein [Grimontia marina]|uniref:SnoaL-like polyketide cyclase n=1 Tax=Grimontia marina TaxID=646534 RepID=A0A128FHZ4_9GAMM|nr:ester cyclase [Grimontia marina]CZF85886.1 SnoaL-like polyketide cyclase [Grimontia marina]